MLNSLGKVLQMIILQIIYPELDQNHELITLLLHCYQVKPNIKTISAGYTLIGSGKHDGPCFYTSKSPYHHRRDTGIYIFSGLFRFVPRHIDR